MNYVAEITDTLQHLKNAQDAVKALKEKYSGSNDILNIYLPSSEYLIFKLKQRIDSLLREYVGGTNSEPDMWIRLQGPDFKEGRAPLSLVSSFIKKLVLANQHAVTLLEEVKYSGQRINKKIKQLAELDLVATAPGSLMLGFQKPAIEYFVDIENPDQELFEAKNVGLKKIEEAQRDSEKSIEGLQLLARAILASEDHQELKKLTDEIKDKKDILKLLYYAREISPTQSSGIESITFFGNFIAKSETKEIVATKQTRTYLKELSNTIIKHERYIEGYGIVREIDLDKMSFRIRTLRFESSIYDDIECLVNKKEYTELDLKQLVDKEIHLTGILTISDTGEIKFLEVDKLFLENFLDEE